MLMGRRRRRRWRRSCREVRSGGKGRSCRDVGGGKCMLGDRLSGGRACTLWHEDWIGAGEVSEMQHKPSTPSPSSLSTSENRLRLTDIKRAIDQPQTDRKPIKRLPLSLHPPLVQPTRLRKGMIHDLQQQMGRQHRERQRGHSSLPSITLARRGRVWR